ncbi:MAG: YkvA family protein [Gemmatimonadota bacterium]|nr:YkvA family protein [Gemmatimonadota bacterium]
MRLLNRKDGGIGAQTRRIAKGAADRLRPIMRPRTGAKRTVVHYISQLPKYVRLLAGLLADRRVSTVDKLLVGAAIAYIIAPLDLVPEFIPFLGQVDDIYLLVLALQRLMRNAGRRVVLEHWAGEPSDLAPANLLRALSAAAFFLPGRVKRRLRGVARR